jgi:hypothetical protein
MQLTPAVIYLYPLNTQVIQINGLQDVVTGLYLDAASGTATLFDPQGNADPVLNGIVMTYLSGSNGNYNGTVPATFNPVKISGGYSLVVTIAQGGVQAQFTIPVVVKPRPY